MQRRSTFIGNIPEVCSKDWNTLAGTGQPFRGHAFLDALGLRPQAGELSPFKRNSPDT